ncbi:MAG: redox-regulated ATPase YchF [Deltaproteobacteria bacterium]|nr:redox-regulated ATPase YchF [Deltaproteobacteria bacterium]
MGLSCGIVGLPNVGKSTLFNALTNAGAQAANYPFCTIEPNIGVVPVRDGRLDRIAGLVGTKVILYAAMEFVDIAGLVKGASKGEGLGNKFLANIRETDAIAHVLRCFDDGDVVHVDGSVDPVRDAAVIHTELALADLEQVDRRMQKAQKGAKSGDKVATAELALLERLYAALDQGRPARAVEISKEEEPILKGFQLLTAKPMLYVANTAEPGTANPYVDRVRAMAAAEGAAVVELSCKTEAEIAELDTAEDRAEFLTALGLTESGLDRLARVAFELLGLQTYFTAGVKEARAWTIRRGWTAPQAAGVIHTDFERGFIKAEVYDCQDLFNLGSETAVAAAGKKRMEGKDYVMRDGDVVNFRFNV